MVVPDDCDAVLATVRLGWYMAEVRGRNRPGAHPGAQLKLPKRTAHALPLEMERTAPELRIEAQTVLRALANRIGVDRESSGASFATAVDRSAKALADAADPAGASGSANTSDPAGAAPAPSGAAPGKPGAPAGEEASTGEEAPAPGAAVPGTAGGKAGTAGAAPRPATAAGVAGGGPKGPGGPAVMLGAPVRLLAGAARGLAGMARPAGTDGASQSPPEATEAEDPACGDWDSLEELIYRFDAHIQDTLAARSDTVACGYQLGRALAECYWALEPVQRGEPEPWASWSFLLGQERCREIGRLLGRLSAYFHPYTAAAIAGSVQVWQSVAESPEWRRDAYPRLYDQIRSWYELILIRQDPTTLIKPYQLLRNYRLVWRTIRGFWAQLVLAALAAAAVAVFAWLLTKPGVSSAVKTLLAALGIAGFSVAGVAAKVQNEAQAMVKRLKQDAYTDLIGLAITTAPLPPRSVRAPGKSAMFRPRTPKGKMTAMLRQRAITPVTPN
jgi:hypothetical protein